MSGIHEQPLQALDQINSQDLKQTGFQGFPALRNKDERRNSRTASRPRTNQRRDSPADIWGEDITQAPRSLICNVSRFCSLSSIMSTNTRLECLAVTRLDLCVCLLWLMLPFMNFSQSSLRLRCRLPWRCFVLFISTPNLESLRLIRRWLSSQLVE